MESNHKSNDKLSLLTNKDLTNRLERLVQSERKITALILAHINEVENRRLFAEDGFASMFDYLTRHLGYDESGAYRRLQAARLLRQVPEISEKLDAGSLNLTQLSQVQTALKQERKDLQRNFGVSNFDLNFKATQVLAKIENKTQKQTQVILAQEFYVPVIDREKVKPQKDESVRLELTFSKGQMQILEQAKALCSHQNPEGQWQDLIVLLAKKEIQRKLGKSKDELKPKNDADSAANSAVPLRVVSAESSSRKYISIHLKRELFRNANHQCQFQSPESGHRCPSRHFLEIEHIRPVAYGGTDAKNNLRIFCREHNRLEAKKWGFDEFKPEPR